MSIPRKHSKYTYFPATFMEIIFIFVFLCTSLPWFHCVDPNEEVNVSENTISVPETESESPKLLILLVDGFRWDYYARFNSKRDLPGFHQLLSSGIQAEYVEPIFPSLSYPSWTTLATGLYPSHHNIVGNYMLYLGDDENPDMSFQLKTNSTKNGFWWQFAEPLWITATKAGQKVYMGDFANCDVPFEGILPTECTGYKYRDVNLKLREHLNKAVVRFRQGYSLAMIYDDSIDHAGHVWGPNSNELRLSIIAFDSLLQELFINLRRHGLLEKVNLILTSDHGMTSIRKETGTEFVKLEDYILDPDDTVYKVVDYGVIINIAANSGKSETLYQQLISMPGVNVYRKRDIPQELNYKESKFIHDILLVAKPGYFIIGLKGDKQIPNESKASTSQPYAASHGYFNMTDMRTIFYATGPAFRKGVVHPAIRLEDEYQIFAHILDLKALPNNGSWGNVAEMLDGGVNQI